MKKFLFLFAFSLFVACSLYDNYDAELMQNAIASIEEESSSSEGTPEESSTSKESSSSKVDTSYVVIIMPSSSSESSIESSNSQEAPVLSSSSLEPMPESSSQALQVSSSSEVTWVCGDSSLVRGELTYETVKINGLCWTATNMNYKPSSTNEYLCYNGEEANCETYGMLYSYEAAELVCPTGWRLPTQEDLQNLLDYSSEYAEFAGAYLKATSGWEGDPGNGSNLLKFTALPGGTCDEEQECFSKGALGIWWTSTEKSFTANYVLKLTGDEDAFYASSSMSKTSYASVRCVKK